MMKPEMRLAVLSTFSLFSLYAIHRILDVIYHVSQSSIFAIANANLSVPLGDAITLLLIAVFLSLGLVLQNRFSRWVSILTAFWFLVVVLSEINPKTGFLRVESFVENSPIIDQFWTPILTATPLWLVGITAVFQIYYLAINRRFRDTFFGETLVNGKQRTVFRKVYLGIIIFIVVAVVALIIWDLLRLFG
ncbi:hypothetical protein [Candidatus Puniceispirillum marinum]|uniref:hypothetical protein n=1 Tax=Candidatus Puniceispirillum marinum TaxID=767892 RepID=UPI0011D1162D|nr:hypothetical protein [Candidatus Puniceispirillum marinum]